MASGVAGDVIDIAFVVPESGPSGIFGPSCRASARLAVSELNDGAGILGREVRLHPVDGGRSPAHVADEVGSLVDMGVIDAVTGWHTSAVRKRLASRLGGRVPYVYTAVYEGGERTPGVFLTGETPADQILPAMRWMLQELGVRTWVVVGNDYVWPRASALATRTYAREVQAEILDEVFVPLGTEDFSRALYRVERTGRADVPTRIGRRAVQPCLHPHADARPVCAAQSAHGTQHRSASWCARLVARRRRARRGGARTRRTRAAAAPNLLASGGRIALRPGVRAGSLGRSCGSTCGKRPAGTRRGQRLHPARPGRACPSGFGAGPVPASKSTS
jgi:hypothetical protein